MGEDKIKTIVVADINDVLKYADHCHRDEPNNFTKCMNDNIIARFETTSFYISGLEWNKRWMERIKQSKTDDELMVIVRKIYSVGFDDGKEESDAINEDREPEYDWHELD